jgi:N-acylneuraminate cytidylyltransferase
VDVVALIPARGGSKGLPRKNLARFLGRPLLAWSIAAGREAELVTRVIVSTDNDEIAAVARAEGADVPFLRPAELAQDLTPDLPVFEHALAWLAEHETYVPDLVVHLRPTSPIRPPGLVDDGIRALLTDPAADSLRVVCEAPANPFKMWRIIEGVLVPLVDVGIPEAYNRPRQELPTAYWQIGVLDVIRPATILEQGSMTGRRILPFVIDDSLAADVDDPASLSRAEHLAHELGLDAAPDRG